MMCRCQLRVLSEVNDSMMGFLEFLEQTALGTFVRESSSFFAFPGFLFLHTIGLSFLVGANVIVSVRLLGIAPGMPVQALRRLFPFMWLGLILTIISGGGLAIAAATTRLLNPILVTKVVLVTIASVILRILEKKVFSPANIKNFKEGDGKAMAAALLVLWLAVTTLGRLIAYSATILGSSH